MKEALLTASRRVYEEIKCLCARDLGSFAIWLGNPELHGGLHMGKQHREQKRLRKQNVMTIFVDNQRVELERLSAVAPILGEAEARYLSRSGLWAEGATPLGRANW